MAKLSHLAFFLLLLAVPFGLAMARVVTTIEAANSSPCQNQLDQEKPDQPYTDLDEIDQTIHQFDADFDQDTLEEIDSKEEEYYDDETSDDDEGYIAMPTDVEQETDSSLSLLNDDDVDSVSEEEGRLGINVARVVTPAFFNSIINQADPSCKGKRFYTRAAFLNATKSYRKFGNLTNTAAKREIAAFFAHVTHETGHLCYIEEIQKSTYCNRASEREWPCAPGKQYYGRGPLQLTWNFNYGPCGKANRFDGLKNPDIVAKNRVIAWKTALWFWMKNVRPVLRRGFGATIRAINGGECGGGRPAAVRARVKYYTNYCRRFNVTRGPNVSC
ncbi:Chitinase 4 [Linum grandiflorum]